LFRHALAFTGAVFYLLFATAGTAYGQQPTPSSYFFVEVRDTSGQAVAGATVTVSNAKGRELLNDRTDKNGSVKTILYHGYDEHHYDLRVLDSGYLPYEEVVFGYMDFSSRGFISRPGELSSGFEDLKNSESQPGRILLVRTPLTAGERRLVETEEPKQQLLRAAKRGDAALVRKLLQEGVEAKTLDARGMPAIAWAAASGDSETIKVLLDAGADVRSRQTPGYQSLLIYLSDGIIRAQSMSPSERASNPEGANLRIQRHDDIVRRFIEAGAGINFENSPRGTVLNKAICHPQACGGLFSTDTIQRLLAAGASLTATDENGWTPLMAALVRHSVPIVQMLLAAGAKPFINDRGKKGQTALMLASAAGFIEAMKLLLQAGADVNAVDEAGETALTLAAGSWNSGVGINELLAAGVSAKGSDKQGRTALMRAAESGDPSGVKLLINAGSAVDARDNRGETALMYVCHTKCGPDLIKLMIAAGAKATDISEEGKTALMYAAQMGTGDAIKILLEARAPVNAKDKEGGTPLSYAVSNHNNLPAEIVRTLLKEGANVNAVDEHGQTAMMLAMRSSDAELLTQILLAAGAAVDTRDKEGRTALMMAVGNEYLRYESVKLLLTAGADVTIKDNQGQTAITLARKFGYGEVAELLEQRAKP
jgi:ankyrin repeat protein